MRLQRLQGRLRHEEATVAKFGVQVWRKTAVLSQVSSRIRITYDRASGS